MATTSVFLPGKSTCLYPQLLPILLICCMVREAHSDHHIFIVIWLPLPTGTPNPPILLCCSYHFLTHKTSDVFIFIHFICFLHEDTLRQVFCVCVCVYIYIYISPKYLKQYLVHVRQQISICWMYEQMKNGDKAEWEITREFLFMESIHQWGWRQWGAEQCQSWLVEVR